jgi:hypothetical protein
MIKEGNISDFNMAKCYKIKKKKNPVKTIVNDDCLPFHSS